MLRRVLAIAFASTALRTFLAIRYYGFETGDDTEIAQEAFRAATGLQYEPWAIRNLFLSQTLVAPFVRFAAAAGIDDPLLLATIARAPFILSAGVNIVLVFLIGRRWLSEQGAALASGLYAIHWLPLVYGSSLYPRIPGTTAILAAVWLTGRQTNSAHAGAGALVATAFAMRYSEVIFLGALLVLVDRRRWAPVLAGFAAGAIVLAGLYDWLSWGAPFSSLIEFARFTLIDQESSSRVARQPAWWYLTALPHWLAPPLWLLLWRSSRTAARPMIAMIGVPLVALSVIHHKELRYLQAVIPFAMLFAVAGAEIWWRAGRKKLVMTLIIVALPLQLTRIGSIEKRSMAAVDAARIMAAKNVRRVSLSQPWAYGGRLFFENQVAIDDIGLPPDPASLAAALPHADCVAMYRSQSIPVGGAMQSTVVTRDRSRPVVMSCRRDGIR